MRSAASWLMLGVICRVSSVACPLSRVKSERRGQVRGLLMLCRQGGIAPSALLRPSCTGDRRTDQEFARLRKRTNTQLDIAPLRSRPRPPAPLDIARSDARSTNTLVSIETSEVKLETLCLWRAMSMLNCSCLEHMGHAWHMGHSQAFMLQAGAAALRLRARGRAERKRGT
jgi:hypothetical protein